MTNGSRRKQHTPAEEEEDDSPTSRMSLDDDESSWRADEVERASVNAGNRPSTCLDRLVRERNYR